MKRLKNFSPFIVMDILDKARRMEDVVHLEVGEPDLEAPLEVVEEFARAVRDAKYKYTSALGLMELRETISAFYHRKYAVSVSPDRIAITPGTSGAFLVIYSLLLESGQKIAFSDPSYPCYKNFAHLFGIKPVFLPVHKDEGYCLRDAHLEKHPPIHAVQVSSPLNPVGSVYSKEVFADLVNYTVRKQIACISDEIYHGLVYDIKEHTALEFDDNVIVVNGFSKAFCMPGFRIGWMILPERLMRLAEMVIQNIFIAANTPAQYAAIKAFNEEYLNKVNATFRMRRDYIYSALKTVFSLPIKPGGAFYLWADIKQYGLHAMNFAEKLLETGRVAVTPGIDFGRYNTDRFIRLAFTRPMNELKEGVRRIHTFLSGLHNK